MALTYEFCVDAPTWPECDQVLADHAAASESGKMDGGDDDMPMMAVNPMMGQLVYTTVALMGAARAGLTLFRWTELIDDYPDMYLCSFDYVYSPDAPICEGRNWVKTYEKIANYSMLAFFGVAAVTQIATLLGAPLAGVNLMVWIYGGMAYALAALANEVFIMYVMDKAFNGDDFEYNDRERYEEDYVTTKQIRTDQVRYSGMNAIWAVALLSQSENWLAAQWMLLDDATKDAWMDGADQPESLFSLMF